MSSNWPPRCCGGSTDEVCGEFEEPVNLDRGRCKPYRFRIPCDAPEVANFDPTLRADPYSYTPPVGNEGDDDNSQNPPPGPDDPVWGVSGDCWLEYASGPSVFENASATACVSAAQLVTS